MGRSSIYTGALERLSVEDDGQFVSRYARAIRGVLTPTAIAANQNNYAPTGLASARILRVTTNGGGPFNITGIDIAQFPAGLRDGVTLRLYNISTNLGDVLRFPHEDGGSTVSNQVVTPLGQTFDLVNRSMCDVWYDIASSRWRLSPAFKAGVTFQAVDAPATATNPGFSETIVLVDTASVNWDPSDVITLPAAPVVQARVTVKDTTGSAGTKPIVVSGNGSTVDGAATQALSLAYGSLCCVFTGAGWVVI